jgi:hypothetical protein
MCVVDASHVAEQRGRLLPSPQHTPIVRLCVTAACGARTRGGFPERSRLWFRKCQDLGCLEWARVGLRGKTGKYCPHPEDRKRDSGWESKGASRDHLERKRRDLTLTRTQYRAMVGKTGNNTPLTSAELQACATLSNHRPLTRDEQDSGSRPLLGSLFAAVRKADGCQEAVFRVTEPSGATPQRQTGRLWASALG